MERDKHPLEKVGRIVSAGVVAAVPAAGLAGEVREMPAEKGDAFSGLKIVSPDSLEPTSQEVATPYPNNVIAVAPNGESASVPVSEVTNINGFSASIDRAVASYNEYLSLQNPPFGEADFSQINVIVPGESVNGEVLPTPTPNDNEVLSQVVLMDTLRGVVFSVPEGEIEVGDFTGYVSPFESILQALDDRAPVGEISVWPRVNGNGRDVVMVRNVTGEELSIGSADAETGFIDWKAFEVSSAAFDHVEVNGMRGVEFEVNGHSVSIVTSLPINIEGIDPEVFARRVRQVGASINFDTVVEIRDWAEWDQMNSNRMFFGVRDPNNRVSEQHLAFERGDDNVMRAVIYLQGETWIDNYDWHAQDDSGNDVSGLKTVLGDQLMLPFIDMAWRGTGVDYIEDVLYKNVTPYQQYMDVVRAS